MSPRVSSNHLDTLIKEGRLPSFILKFAHVSVTCKVLAEKAAAQSIANLAKPNSMDAKKAAHIAMLKGEGATLAPAMKVAS
jgi:hypothetical protein